MSHEINPSEKTLIAIVSSLIIGIIVVIPMILQGINWPLIIFSFIRWATIGLILTCIVLEKGWIDAIFLSLFVILDYYSTFALQLHWFGYFNSLFCGAIILWPYIDKPKKEHRILNNIFLCLLLSVFFFLQKFAPQYTIEMGVAKSVALAIIIFNYIKPNISYFIRQSFY